MKKQKTPEVIRQDIPVFQADPERGLTMQQAEERKAGAGSTLPTPGRA